MDQKLEQLFVWIGRLLIGAMTFFLQQMYGDFKAIRTTVNNIMIMQASNAKEIELLKEDYRQFKSETQTKFIDELRNLRQNQQR
jgi:hypothetical protein